MNKWFTIQADANPKGSGDEATDRADSQDEAQDEGTPNEEVEEEGAKDEGAQEEEEEEPEDIHPQIRTECEDNPKCAGPKRHFEHCQDKVREGRGFKGEDCVEELFHVMHCADECAAPRLFSKLR